MVLVDIVDAVIDLIIIGVTGPPRASGSKSSARNPDARPIHQARKRPIRLQVLYGWTHLLRLPINCPDTHVAETKLIEYRRTEGVGVVDY